MLRRFNYTGRVRLLREDVKFKLKNESNGAWSFEATLALDEYELPNDALVAVEAYRQTSWMRFDFGTIGAILQPSDRQLTEFDSPEDILFRVRVTSPGTPEEPHGLLLAEADRGDCFPRKNSKTDEFHYYQCCPPILGRNCGGSISWTIRGCNSTRQLATTSR